MPFPAFSPVIAGCMKWGHWGARFSTAQYRQAIEACLETGITSFDHADIYGDYTTEAEFGAALKEMPARRGQMQLISKCGIQMVGANRPQHTIKSYNTSAAHIIGSAENSLHNLQTDYLDVLLIHRPDPLLQADEVAEAFTQLQQQGKVRHFGVSNFNAQQMALLQSRFPIKINQLEISILRPEPFTSGILDYCQQHHIIPMAWGPLGSGQLFAETADERSRRILAVARLLAEKYGVLPEQVLLAWLQQHPSGIIPVMGTSRTERLQQALAAAKLKLEREEWFMLWRASTGREVD